MAVFEADDPMLALSAVRSTCLPVFPSELAFWRGTVVVVGSSGWGPSFFWLSENYAPQTTHSFRHTSEAVPERLGAYHAE